MIQELNHVSVSVVDIEKSVQFYTKVIGMEIDYRAYHEGDKISKVVGVDNAVLDICVVRKGPCCIELIEYKNKVKSRKEYKRQNEPGLIHISFIVTDVDEEYKKIHSLGYESFSSPMVTRENGPKICYFRGPDNVIIELYEKR